MTWVCAVGNLLLTGFKNYASTYSYKQYNETVSNFTILDNYISANISLEVKKDYTLYSLWRIMLPLDDMYPGGVTAFKVLMWADTGEIGSFTPIGFYGTLDDDFSPNTQQTPLPTAQLTSQQNQGTIPDSLIIAIALTTASIFIAGYLLCYRRKKYKQPLTISKMICVNT